MGTVEIVQHAPSAGASDFFEAGQRVFRQDENWIPPLQIMMKDQLSPHSPFFQHADVTLFTARHHGELVGRISAQVDHEHLARYRDGVGFFGFFDTVDDEKVARGLLEAAATWLKQRGMSHMRGPLNLSINQEVGMLVDGFDTPPMVMMPHSRPYQAALAERCGLVKARDLYAWRWEIGPHMPQRCQKAHQAMTDLGVRFRSVELKSEIDHLVAIQDDAWRENWGHVSMTHQEARQLRDELRLILDPEIAIVTEVEGQLAGMALAIPNLNEVIRDFSGHLSPAKVAKLLWRLKVERPKSARVALLGLKSEVRKQRKYMPLALALIAELNARGYRRGYRWAELSWTLEDNGPVNAMIRAAGGTIYKTYRVFEKALRT